MTTPFSPLPYREGNLLLWPHLLPGPEIENTTCFQNEQDTGREEEKKMRGVLLVSQLASKDCPLSAGCWSSLTSPSPVRKVHRITLLTLHSDNTFSLKIEEKIGRKRSASKCVDLYTVYER
ncbi:hypothetical protein POM88_044941 [Heracleum sosnowskyi]|uniref:Uncharacterized protein n=1 Tax=Heracleum sosnowskyi TaxID=360622 RepID=A0AAD8M5S5_9APIA|nr:hypothetical protein POM88_044941 [Heracleum sosnowskyi]